MKARAIEKLEGRFPAAEITEVLDTLVITVAAESVHETIACLRDELGCSLLLDVTAVDYLQYTGREAQRARFSVVYTLRNWKKNLLFQVVAPVADPEEGVATVTDLFSSANWGERETYDQYGIRFKNHPDLRRILNHWQFQGHPLRKDFPITNRQICSESDSLEGPIRARLAENGVSESAFEDINTEVMFLNLGPSHPATHGAIRILVALDGESVLANVNEIGYLHRGFEKNAEKMTYNQVIPMTDRLNYCSALMNNVAYAKAVESWLGIELPERAQFMRVILSEFFRVQDHLTCIAANLVDMGGLTNYWYLFNQKEASYDLISRMTGARLTSSFTRIGGMYRDFYDGWESDMEFQLKAIEQGISDVLALIKKNRIVHDRTQNCCCISADLALSYGLTGPNLRASGVPFDLRKDAPYYYYDTFDFTIPVGSHGDVYDRMMVRFEEMFQSIGIIRQAMKMIPGGAVYADDKRAVLPAKAEVYNNIEALANHFKLVFEGVKARPGAWYDSFEAANGELGFYFVSDGSGVPYKCKVRPPCFYAMGAFHEMIEGAMIADAILNLGSINIIGGELDR